MGSLNECKKGEKKQDSSQEVLFEKRKKGQKQRAWRRSGFLFMSSLETDNGRVFGEK